MADSTDWQSLQGNVRSALERVVRTPQIEKALNVVYVEDEDFLRYTQYRHLILIATLQSGGRIGRMVRTMVSDPEVLQRVEEGTNTVFPRTDPWARNQLMCVVAAKDIETLKNSLEAYSPFIYEMFDADIEEMLKKETYRHGEQKETEEHLISAYGWKIRIQRDFYIAQEQPSEGFIWFRRMLPERWIFVRWIEGGDSTMLKVPWIIAERNRIGAVYYGGDKVHDQYLYSQPATFFGRPAQITTGLWDNPIKLAGGPFKNYTFYDALSRRIYMIDLAVYAPGMDKAPLMRRLEVMARSFRTIFESEDKK